MRSSVILTVISAATALALPQPRGQSTPSTGGRCTKAMADQILKAHNERRACCGAPPLVWSDEIAEIAAAYAAECPTDHSGADGLGENLYWTSESGGNGFCDAGLKAWTEDEQSLYDGSFSHGAGHYSQVVWHETTEVGCGWEPDCSGRGNGMGTLVCNYRKPGNVKGKFQDNVGTCDFSKLGSGLGKGLKENTGSRYSDEEEDLVDVNDVTNRVTTTSKFDMFGSKKSRRSHIDFHKARKH